MPIIVPQRGLWTRQPRGPVEFAANNPLTSGIANWLVGSQQHRWTINGTVPQVGGHAGQAWKLDGSNSHYLYQTPLYATSSAWTYLLVFSVRSVGVQSSIITMAQTPGDPARDRSVEVLSTGAIRANVYDGTGDRSATTSAIVDTVDKPYVIAVRATGSAVDVGYQGAVVATQTTVNPGYTGYSSNYLVLGWGSLTQEASGSYTDLAACVTWSRALGDAEFREIQLRPWQLFRRRSARLYMLPAAGGGNVSVALTGSSATASAGTLGITHTQALTGSAATGAAGTVAPSTSKALSGQAGTASAGTIAPSASVALSGQGATSAAGTIAPSTSKALSGQAATGSAGTIAPATSVGLSGSQATGAQGNVSTGADKTAALTGASVTASAGTATPSVTVALNGSSAAASAGSLTAATSPALSGQAATSAAGTIAPSSSVPLTGSQATVGQGVVSAPGNVTVALSGIGATASAGTLGLQLSIAVSGSSMTASRGSVGVTRTQALSGQALTTAQGTITTTGGESTAPLDEPRFRQRIRTAARRINGKPVRGGGRIGGSIQ